MSQVRCQHCRASVFTVAGWSDVDHCPQCGRVIGPESTIERAVRLQLRRELGRFTPHLTPTQATQESKEQESKA